MTFYSTRPLDTMRIGANGIAPNATVSVGVWALEDAWAAQADQNGTVLGNVTTSATNGTCRFKWPPSLRDEEMKHVHTI